MPRRAALLALSLACFAPAARAQPPGPDHARHKFLEMTLRKKG